LIINLDNDSLKAIATPLPAIWHTGATIQNATVQLCRKKTLQRGADTKNIGHAIKQSLRTPPVPILCCKGGNTKSNQVAWEMPIEAMNMEIRMGEKP